ncbi:hypothetical protein [Cellulosimicrobium arenosum]|uniref:Uncharacterized protein n=1 Tax=Cellulosimicrobium arenosum TaxID=2708133 RepID=A0A927G8C8_9MICO|nr:hypothetical protein [Cellulosimicrobium arenosum]MBD8078794.1 hypothetical protein [Cellulosimicrobium arenosum]
MHPDQRELEQGGLGGTADDWARVLEAERARECARRQGEERLLVTPVALVTGSRLLGVQVLLAVVGAGLLLGAGTTREPSAGATWALVGLQVVLVLVAVALPQSVARGGRASWTAALHLAAGGVVLAVVDVLVARVAGSGTLSLPGLGAAACSAAAGLGALVSLTSRSARAFVAQRSVPLNRR